MTRPGRLENLSHSRLFRFALVGAAGFLVNEAALWFALRLLALGAYAGGMFSFFITVTFTWWGNRTLTFREHAATARLPVAKEWVAFVLANGIGFLVNYAVYASLIAAGPQPLDNPFFALACGTLSGLMFNFVLSSRLVFRASKAS